MRKTATFSIFIILLLFTYTSCAQGLFSTGSILEFRDPAKNENWSRIDFTVNSVARNNVERTRFCANIIVLKQKTKDSSNYYLKFYLLTKLQEFPLKEEAYLLLNDHAFPIKLENVGLQHNELENSLSPIDSSALIVQGIRVSDQQLFRKKSDISKAMNHYMSIKTASIVVYSDEMPIDLQLGPFDCQKLTTIIQH